jgi:hypothetical protein
MNETKQLFIPGLAEICYEAVRRYGSMIGEEPLAAWQDAEESQRDTAIAAVMFYLSPDNNDDPDSWPNPGHDQLPPAQGTKDCIFRGIVTACSGIVNRTPL